MAPAAAVPSADAHHPPRGFCHTAAEPPAAAGVGTAAGSPAAVSPAVAADPRAAAGAAGSSGEVGRSDTLLRRLAADAVAAAAAGAGVAPIVTIIDRSIVRNAAGVEKLWTSVASGLRQLLLRPVRFAAGRDFRIVLGVYVGTYAAANSAESLALCYSSSSNISSASKSGSTGSSSTPSAGVVKFVAATAANMYLCIRKDIIFAKLFGRKPAAAATPFIKAVSSNSSSKSSNCRGVGTCKDRSDGCGSSGIRHSTCGTAEDKNVAARGRGVAAAASPTAKVGQATTATHLRSETGGPAAALSSTPVAGAFCGPAAAAAPGTAVRISDTSASAAHAVAAVAAAAAGETEKPRRFPLASTMLFVARDSLTIAASFNAPAYVAAWLSKGERRPAAGGGEDTLAEQRRLLQQVSRQLGHEQEQQQEAQQISRHPRQQDEEKQKLQVQEGDRRIRSAQEGHAAEAASRRLGRPVVARQDGGDSWLAAAADVMKDEATADGASTATTTSTSRQEEATGAVPGGTSAATAGAGRTETRRGSAEAAAAAGARGDVETGAAAPPFERQQGGEGVTKTDVHRMQMQIPSALALSAAQLLCPVAVQFLSTPLHLLSLDLYNHPSRSAARRCSFLVQTYTSTVAARVARILPAFGIGGIVNNYTRMLLQQQLHVGDLPAPR